MIHTTVRFSSSAAAAVSEKNTLIIPAYKPKDVTPPPYLVRFYRDYRFKTETTGVVTPGTATSLPSQQQKQKQQQALHLEPKKSKKDVLLLELRRSTTPPEFPGSRLSLPLKCPSPRKVSSKIGVDRGAGELLVHSQSDDSLV